MASYAEFDAWLAARNDVIDEKPGDFGVKFAGDDPLPPLPEPEKSEALP